MPSRADTALGLTPDTKNTHEIEKGNKATSKKLELFLPQF